jgi:phosphohistidine swiveling domain-containing protein
MIGVVWREARGGQLQGYFVSSPAMRSPAPAETGATPLAAVQELTPQVGLDIERLFGLATEALVSEHAALIRITDGGAHLDGLLELEADPTVARDRLTAALGPDGPGDASLALLSLTELILGAQPPHDQDHDLALIARGIGWGHGVVSGPIVYDLNHASTFGPGAIAVVEELKPAELVRSEGLRGVVVARAGLTSHAVLAARGRGLGCLVGLNVAAVRNAVPAGTTVTLDGGAGALWYGATGNGGDTPASPSISLAGSASPAMAILGSASDASQVHRCMDAGAAGIGLYRLGHTLLSSAEAASAAAAVATGTHVPDRETLELIRKVIRTDLARSLPRASGSTFIARLPDLPLVELPHHLLSSDDANDAHLRASSPFVSSAEGVRGLRHRGGRALFRACLEGVFEAFAETPEELRPREIKLLVPFVTSPWELDIVGSDARAAAEFVGTTPGAISVGAMVESPFALSMVGTFARSSSVIAFGLNDLTSCHLGLARDAAYLLPSEYWVGVFHGLDPFVEVAASSIDDLIEGGIQEARTANPDVQVVLCGQQASRIENAEWLAQSGADAIVVEPADISQQRLAIHWAERRSAHWSALGRTQPVSVKRFHTPTVRGQAGAMIWAERLSQQFGIRFAGHWKLFKRDLVASFFGPTECQRYYPAWDPESVAEYLNGLEAQGKRPRLSVFPQSIACHATSFGLENRGSRTWLSLATDVDRTAVLEAFPEQVGGSLCFRVDAHRDSIAIEAGFGQAMYLFEEARGRDETVVARLDWGGATATFVRGASAEVKEVVESFLDRHGSALLGRLRALKSLARLEWLGIEGYFSQGTGSSPVIVDCDLPMDAEFFGDA